MSINFSNYFTTKKETRSSIQKLFKSLLILEKIQYIVCIILEAFPSFSVPFLSELITEERNFPPNFDKVRRLSALHAPHSFRIPSTDACAAPRRFLGALKAARKTRLDEHRAVRALFIITWP